MMPTTWAELVKQRFAAQRTPIPGDPVPWHLDDKNAAYEWASQRGFRTPLSMSAPTACKAVKSRLAARGDFVLKRPDAHSGRGTFVLTRVNRATFFEHLRLEAVELTALESMDDTEHPWLVEERVDGGIEGAHIPYDYKLYCFHGEPVMVFQIDRTVTPPRVAIFDGAFLPMTPTTHYTVDPARGGYGSHVLPRSAESMLHMAREMAGQLDTQFVRIDLFDSPTGPVFGEFTFAPGGVHAGMIALAPEVHAHLDKVLRKETPATALSGFDIDVQGMHEAATPMPTLQGDDAQLRRLHHGAVRGDRRYAHRAMAHLNRASKLWHVFELSLRAIAVANGDNKYAAHIALSLVAPRAPLIGSLRQREYAAIALEYHRRRRGQFEWDAYRFAQVTAVLDHVAGHKIMKKLAQHGSRHAQSWLSARA